MIRKCLESELETIYEIINDSSIAYKDRIPADRWKEPYMSMDELQEQINDGVIFYCLEDDLNILGVMGIQDRKDVNLIRHAYVRTDARREGVGGQLLRYLQKDQEKPILIGTWADAVWAIEFYQKHGFHVVEREEQKRLLKKYWAIPARQVETSVVLADGKYDGK
ncbi:GNAT family N-acetyltransferase [Akkermansia muciniphila]